jgi:hypothetical protein
MLDIDIWIDRPVVNKAQAPGLALTVVLGGVTIRYWDQLDVDTISERE